MITCCNLSIAGDGLWGFGGESISYMMFLDCRGPAVWLIRFDSVGCVRLLTVQLIEAALQPGSRLAYLREFLTN